MVRIKGNSQFRFLIFCVLFLFLSVIPNSLFISSLFEIFVHLVVTWPIRAADLVRQFGTLLVGRCTQVFKVRTAETKTWKQERERKKLLNWLLAFTFLKCAQFQWPWTHRWALGTSRAVLRNFWTNAFRVCAHSGSLCFPGIPYVVCIFLFVNRKLIRQTNTCIHLRADVRLRCIVFTLSSASVCVYAATCTVHIFAFPTFLAAHSIIG